MKKVLKGIKEKAPLKDLVASYIAGFSLMYLFPAIILGGEFLRSYILYDFFHR